MCSKDVRMAEKNGELRVKYMRKILCYIYENMADFEIVLTLHCLRNTGKFDIVTISENREKIMAQSGLKFVPDMQISELSDAVLKECAGLLIPGGPINPVQNEICPIVQYMEENNKLVAALCFAPQFLGRAGVLKTHHFTTSCSRQHIEKIGCDDPFYWDNYEEKRMVMDKNILTAKGFAFVDMAEKISEIFNVFDNDDARKSYFDNIRKG